MSSELSGMEAEVDISYEQSQLISLQLASIVADSAIQKLRVI